MYLSDQTMNMVTRFECKAESYIFPGNDTYNRFSIGIKGKQMHLNASISLLCGSLTLLFMYIGYSKHYMEWYTFGKIKKTYLVKLEMIFQIIKRSI